MHTPWSTCMSPLRWCEDIDACDCSSHPHARSLPRSTSLPLLPSRASQRQRGETERRDREKDREREREQRERAEREQREQREQRERTVYTGPVVWLGHIKETASTFNNTPYPTLNHTACLEARSLPHTTRATHHVPIYHKMKMACMDEDA